jgi:hydroxylaminobenzene mutase
MKTRNRQLMWHGMFLFLLGLLTGLVEQRFTNVRMGLAGHIEGVINGIFLVAPGAIWTEVRLPSAAKATTYRTALYGTYMDWLSTILAAVWGTATHQPILAAGYSAQPWQETLVAAGLSDRRFSAWSGGSSCESFVDRKEPRGRLSAKELVASDSDKDRTLSKDEYLAIVEQRFRAADADIDGTLTAKELNSRAGRALLRLLQ